MITRRQFLKYSAIAGAAATLPLKFTGTAHAQYGTNSPALRKFIQPIRSIASAGVFTPTTVPTDVQIGIPVAVSDGTRTWPTVTATHYTIQVRQFTDTLHPNLNPTTIWGYNPAGNATPRHLGGIIAALKNSPVQLTFQNTLPPANIIPVDTTIPGANQAMNRVAVHLHGGFVPWISDGGPFDWWAPDGTHGLSFLNNQVLRNKTPEDVVAPAANEAEYYYPNQQSARLMWYHDHAWGITRTNAYAGVATGYVVTDTNAEEAAVVAQGVPGPLAANTFYMVFQDKIFNTDGSLFYASVYNQAIFGPLGIPSFGGAAGTPPTPSVVPEFFGDTMLVNGSVYPYIEVTPSMYRFRMLNACNARFLNPRLVFARSNNLALVNSAEPSPNAIATSFTQIGTEGGFLPAPVVLSTKPNGPHALIAPAERADMIVDFSKVPVGSVLILYNDAPGPFPGGAAIFDHFPQNPKTPFSTPGFGPNTRTILQVRVVAGTGQAAPAAITLPPLFPTPIVTQVAGVPNTPVINRAAGTATVGGITYPLRPLTLNEGFDQFGRLAQFLGTNLPNPAAPLPFFGRRYTEDAPTEVVTKDAIEVWEIANLTADTHPIHFHLVNVQILARQPFNAKNYAGTPALRGMAAAPDPNEIGWKETVRMNPGEVTWIVQKFEFPVVPFTVPTSPRATAATCLDCNTPGMGLPAGPVYNEYVWHCHILEHEEHDMMRPLLVTGQNPVG